MSTLANAYGKVAVLMGGLSAEREVSLMSGTGVLQALRAQGVDAYAFDPSQRDLHELRREGFARCFIALHGRYGEDGTVQGALELMGIPYTGSGVMASSIAMDKVMTKRVWRAEGLPTPDSVTLLPHQHQGADLRAVAQRLGLPLMVKAPHEGSSLGISKVIRADQLEAAVALSARYDSAVLCEAFVAGEEVTCAVVQLEDGGSQPQAASFDFGGGFGMNDGAGDGAVALPVIRIMAPEGAYDYQNKYFTNDVRYLCPSGLPEGEEREIQRLSLAAYRALGCRGWGRVDVMIRAADRQAFLLEINTAPGMTGHSLVPMAAKATGISYEALCLRLLSTASLDNRPPDEGAP
ncbi:MAG: D-alanine--D-alanine ligase [Burkholderiaceae bacterium]